MKTLFKGELERYGCNEELIERIVRYGDNALLSWFIHSTCKEQDFITNAEMLRMFSNIMNQPVHRLKYIFYRAKHTPIRYLQEDFYFMNVMKTLQEEYVCEYGEDGERLSDDFNTDDLWDKMAEYNAEPLRRLACEILLDKNVAPQMVADYIGVSLSYVYKVR